MLLLGAQSLTHLLSKHAVLACWGPGVCQCKQQLAVWCRLVSYGNLQAAEYLRWYLHLACACGTPDPTASHASWVCNSSPITPHKPCTLKPATCLARCSGVAM